jgi:hypothetical protein
VSCGFVEDFQEAEFYHKLFVLCKIVEVSSKTGLLHKEMNNTSFHYKTKDW